MWTPKCAEAFSNLKILLTSSPLLVCPNFMKWFVLETDASEAGLGAVLSQKQDELMMVDLYTQWLMQAGSSNLMKRTMGPLNLIEGVGGEVF